MQSGRGHVNLLEGARDWAQNNLRVGYYNKKLKNKSILTEILVIGRVHVFNLGGTTVSFR